MVVGAAGNFKMQINEISNQSHQYRNEGSIGKVVPTLLEDVCTGGAGSGLLQDPEAHDSKHTKLKIFQTY